METLDSLQLRLYRIKKSSEHLYWMLYFTIKSRSASDKLPYLTCLLSALRQRGNIRLPVEDAYCTDTFPNILMEGSGVVAKTDFALIVDAMKTLLGHVDYCLHYWPEIDSPAFDTADLQRGIDWTQWKTRTKHVLTQIHFNLAACKQDMAL